VPVEIKELVIRAVVGHGAAPAVGDGMAASGGTVADPQESAASEAVVDECVRQVLRILAKERER
jgi:hypothetical protein